MRRRAISSRRNELTLVTFRRDDYSARMTSTPPSESSNANDFMVARELGATSCSFARGTISQVAAWSFGYPMAMRAASVSLAVARRLVRAARAVRIHRLDHAGAGRGLAR